MEIKKSITINIDEDEIKKMVVEYLSTNGFGATVDDVKFVIDTKTESSPDVYDMYDYSYPYLKCCSVTIKCN